MLNILLPLMTGAIFIVAGIIFLIVMKKKGLVGTHQINYRDIEGIQPQSSISIPVPVLFSEVDYVYKKRLLTGKMILNVGPVLDSLLKVSVREPIEQSDKTVTIKELEVSNLHIGYAYWSERLITVKFIYEVHNKGAVISSGIIEETGKGTGTEYGLEASLPVSGLSGIRPYYMCIEWVMSTALQKCLSALSKEIEPFIN